MNVPLTISLVAIILAIVLGNKFKINMGVLGACFAMLIGQIFLDMKVGNVISLWPIKITFYLTVVTFFYGFAVKNGTMKTLGEMIIYKIRGRAALVLPISVLACALLGFCGVQSTTVLGPLVFSIAYACGLPNIGAAIMVPVANNIGGDNPLNGQGGIVSSTLIAEAGYQNPAIPWGLYANSTLKQILLCVVIYVLFRCWKGKDIDISQYKEAPRFNEVQKKNIVIIAITVGLMLVFQLLGTLVGGKFLKLMAKIFEPQTAYLMGIAACAICKVGKTREAVTNVPENTVFMIGGMGMLLGIASKAGLVDSVVSIVSTSLPRFWVPAALALFGGFMGAFSSGISVVFPLMFPMVPGLAAITGINPLVLFSSIYIGTLSTSLSPFSSAGGQMVSFCPNQDDQPKLSNQMLMAAICVCVAVSLLCSLGLFSLIPSLIPIW